MVEYVEYKGQRYPFVYDYYAMSRMQGIKDEVKENELFDYLVYYSIESGCNLVDQPFTIKKGDKECEFTPKDAAFLIGSVGVEKIISMRDQFIDDEAAGDVDDKKK